jgi:23S rRNA (guanosine2251-2'-O)-methyltransferase
MPWQDLEPHYRMVPPEHVEPIPRNPVHIILDNIRSAYNTGSVFRTSDAGAVEHIHLCGMTAFPPNAKLGKTALGAYDYVPWTHHARTLDAIDLLQGAGIPCVAVEVAEGAVSAFDYDWPRPVTLIFGNEVTGVAPEVLARADAVADIPMMGHKNSINVATAFGVVLYEVLRRWGAVGPAR